MATIIKREAQAQSSGTPMRGVAYDLSDMADQAEDYLNRVRSEAAKIIQEAKQESAKIRQQAEEAGRQAAEAAVEKILDEKVTKQMNSLTPILAKAAQQIDDSRQDWLRHWENSIVQLSCAMAARIVGYEISQHPEIALEWIQDALKLAAGSGDLTVQLHPTDHQSLGNHVQQLAAVFSPAAPAKVVASEDISLGGCVVKTEFGSIDMQLESQLARLAEEMS